MMGLALDLVRDAERPELTAERKSELDGIIRPAIAPLAATRDRARAAWLRRRVAFALYDQAVDEAWLAARKAHTVAGAVLPAGVVESVFASMLVGAAEP